MGLFGWLLEKAGDVVCKVVDAIDDAKDWLNEKLGRKTYNPESVHDHVDVDRVLSEFREKIQKNVASIEKECMKSIYDVFNQLKATTSERFPDLVEIVEAKQKNVVDELSGTVNRYVKEHISKNDPDFVKVLEMVPGDEKKRKLADYENQVLKDAEKQFNSKLIKYIKDIRDDFIVRLEVRKDDQKKQLQNQIDKYEQIEKEKNEGCLNVDKIIDEYAPSMEAAVSIITVLDIV